jgi:hypothetical protein
VNTTHDHVLCDIHRADTMRCRCGSPSSKSCSTRHRQSLSRRRLDRASSQARFFHSGTSCCDLTSLKICCKISAMPSSV